ncbi:MAG TPA: DUF2235 domain-containing protein [Allosphingosinicella sp.]
MARNLISLIDGTMVSASKTGGYGSYSNVFELACLLQLKDRSADGSPQIVFYTSGISSQPDNSSIYNLMTGNSIKSQIVDQYTNICANFDFASAGTDKPDKIYLFGFSRGAMAIRALAGLIAEFGLLRPRDIRHLPIILEAWDRSRGRASLRGSFDLVRVEIEFIGLFDSVMGGIERLSLFNPIRFKNARLHGRCKHGVHILAIDENRPFFKPKPFEGVSPGRTAGGDVSPDRYLRQIWMPGVHSDIGGTGNATWGRAALLAMAFYIDKFTELALDAQWLREKERNLRIGIDERTLFIERHKGLFARHVRTPVPGGGGGEHRRHPICDQLTQVNYDGSENFDWREKVFQQRFAEITADQDLTDYFRKVLEIGVPKGAAATTATAAAQPVSRPPP